MGSSKREEKEIIKNALRSTDKKNGRLLDNMDNIRLVDTMDERIKKHDPPTLYKRNAG